MSRISSRAARVATVAATVAVLGASPAAARVHAPKSGSHYKGSRGFVVYVSGKSLELVAFDFPCGSAKGRTSLNAIKLRRSSKGYRFRLKTHGSASYSDGRPDENVAVALSGRFSRSARVVRGKVRVRSGRCGNTGTRRWKAKRS